MFILQFVKTILSQGHLTPLPLYVSPVYWAYDYALRVYPVPDMLVIADKYDPFTVTNTDCLCINPVRFPYALQNKTCTNNLEFINSFMEILGKLMMGQLPKGMQLYMGVSLTICTALYLHKCGVFFFTGFFSKEWVFIQGILPLQQDS